MEIFDLAKDMEKKRNASKPLNYEPLNVYLCGYKTKENRQLRAKIPGGWLLRSGDTDTVAFIPDPNHEWDGGSID